VGFSVEGVILMDQSKLTLNGGSLKGGFFYAL
jgi:hypothetical protein